MAKPIEIPESIHNHGRPVRGDRRQGGGDMMDRAKVEIEEVLLDVSAWLLDRADQYDLEGGFWVAVVDCAKGIANGEVQRAKDNGDLDDELYDRVHCMRDSNIMAAENTTFPDAD